MPADNNNNNANANDQLLELDSPKLVFYRQHAIQKLYHQPGHYSNSCGVLVRSLDMRHTEKKWRSDDNTRFNNDENSVSKRTQRFMNRHTVTYPTRQKIIKKDQFGLDTLNLSYSLGKKKRWELAEYFEENAKSYQHPNEKISTILATSESPFWYYLAAAPQLFPSPGFWRIDGCNRINRLISSDENGKLTIKENNQSRGLSSTYLEPLTPATQQPKPNRKLNKRQKRLAAAKCQEDPVRITYYVLDPKTTLNFLDSTAQSRWNTSYEKERRRPNKTRLPLDYDELGLDEEVPCDCEPCRNYRDYDIMDDANSESSVCQGCDNSWTSQFKVPGQMNLSDFIEPDVMEMIQFESEFEFLGIHENFDIGDYVFVDTDLENIDFS